jgi:superfamily II DNA/RNA helicase
MDHIRRTTLSLKAISCLVLDEADRNAAYGLHREVE